MAMVKSSWLQPNTIFVYSPPEILLAQNPVYRALLAVLPGPSTDIQACTKYLEYHGFLHYIAISEAVQMAIEDVPKALAQIMDTGPNIFKDILQARLEGKL